MLNTRTWTNHRLYRPAAIGMSVILCGSLLTPFAGASPRHFTTEKDATRGWNRRGSADISPLETRVMGQSRWLRGGAASLRVIVNDHKTGKPVEAGVELALVTLENGKPTDKSVPLYKGHTSNLGTLDAQFKSPTVAPGAYQLVVQVDSPLGKDRIEQNIQLEESVQLMLTADKPLYQPGQTIHLRALALDRATRATLAEQPIIFEIEDAKGNKVYKKRDTLSKFGIAGTDFVLANEVNMGTFTLRALLDSGQTEKKVRVERYVLPKFKVGLTTEKPYYLPGDVVKGTVQADYFFGKPVAGSEVTMELNTIDIGVTKLAELKGKTDATGGYKFEFTLPNNFVGQPFEQGKAVIGLQAKVKDTADHTQEANKSVPVVREPVLLVVVPESRQIVPGVANRVYIAAGTPDGAPLKNAKVTVSVSEPVGVEEKPVTAELTTDALGLAVYEFTPKKEFNQQVTLAIKATTVEGQSTTRKQRLDVNAVQEGVLLRTDRTLTKVGERLNLSTITAQKGGTVYLDVIRNRQTILTRALDTKNGQASLALPITDDMVGTVEIRAYKILPSEDIVRDTRTVIVSPADDLDITVTADAQTYRPGGEATLKFSVHDKNKRPVASAIGLAVVDESVFALSELQPGLEKIYFMLEKELMEPKYEIHGLRYADLLSPVREAEIREPQRQRAAGLLLASYNNQVPPQEDFDFRVNTYAVRWEKVRQEVFEEMGKVHQKISTAIRKFNAETKTSLTVEQSLFFLVDKGYLKTEDLRDRWGNFYKADTFGQKTYDNGFALNSAGPDGKWGTMDDVVGAGNTRFSGLRRGRAGGFGGGRMELMDERAIMRDGAALPMPAGAAMGGAKLQQNAVFADAVMSKSDTKSKDKNAAGDSGEPTRVREYFPETMYWNPALLTDEKGSAELKLPVADSITTWRMSLSANSAKGQLGSTTASLRVFQDFFADLDLPVSLTQNDRIEIPVAVYNYLRQEQDVVLTLAKEPWFTLEGDAVKTVHMAKDEVKVVYFPLTVRQLGRHTLMIDAKGSKLSDAMRRTIDVTPDGKEFRPTINDRLDAGEKNKVEKVVGFPNDAIAGASGLWVKLYPGTFSTIVEGLDGILRMPSGCFEQTSSTTYPNVLVLDYLKKMKRTNPELQLKAEQYINVGYQRLVTFEVPGGGFSWFGQAPAHQVLTAYGLLEFGDMAKVHDVDPGLIARTQNWLASQQKPDGTWEEKNAGIAEGIINRQTGGLRTTAYIAWALSESGYKGAPLEKGIAYVKAHRKEAKDPYTLALILNLLTKTERDRRDTDETANDLIALATVTDKAAFWTSGDTKTFTGATKAGADLETTGLAAYGLVKWGRSAGFTTKVLTHLVQSKDSFGTWSSTQGTVWAMKSLLLASAGGGQVNKGTVTILANGQKVGTFAITPEDNDVMRQIDLAEAVQPGNNAITLQYEGEGTMLYQIAGRYYLPWNKAEEENGEVGPLAMTVEYDKTMLAQDDTATVKVRIKNRTDKIAEMPLLDIGVPPGFTVLPDDLETAVATKKISKYSVAARQVIVYLEKLAPGETLTLTYKLKAKYPIKARTPLSKAYPYYNPEQAVVSAPQNIQVQKQAERQVMK